MHNIQDVEQGSIYKFFDFCAGIGSAHLAFKNLGLDCAGYSEIVK